MHNKVSKRYFCKYIQPLKFMKLKLVVTVLELIFYIKVTCCYIVFLLGEIKYFGLDLFPFQSDFYEWWCIKIILYKNLAIFDNNIYFGFALSFWNVKKNHFSQVCLETMPCYHEKRNTAKYVYGCKCMLVSY